MPVDYSILIEGIQFHFEPYFDPYDVKAPSFVVKKENGKYIFNAPLFSPLKEQVIEDLEAIMGN